MPSYCHRLRVAAWRCFPRCSVMASITRQKITADSLSFRAVRPNASLQSSRGKAEALWREAIPSAMEMLFFTLSRLRRRLARSLPVTGQLDLGLRQHLGHPGDRFVVAPTTIGRIALVLGEELAVPEVFGTYSAERADIVAAPSGKWVGAVVELIRSCSTKRRHGIRPLLPLRLRSLANSGWRLRAGQSLANRPRYCSGPEPVIATPPRTAKPGDRLNVEVTAPWSGTWINQDQLIGGQQPWNTLPLTLSKNSECLRSWRKADGWKLDCQQR